MTEADAPVSQELERLRARLDRERRARRQAELIAERGMRELWENNRDLQERVERRTADLRHLADALELAASARLEQIGAAVDGLVAELDVSGTAPPAVCAGAEEIRSLAGVGGDPPAEAIADDPVVVVDHIIERWQRRVARSGQLLAAEVGDVGWLRVSWGRLVAIAEVLLGGIAVHGGPGSVVLGLDRIGDELVLSVVGSVRQDRPSTEPIRGANMNDWAPFGPLAAELCVARRLAAGGDGELVGQLGEHGALTVRAHLPIS